MTSGDQPAPARRRRRNGPSTATKMLAILSLGLLPLGIAAIFGSIDNARDNRAQAVVQARAILAVHAQRFSLSLSRTAFTIRAARDAIAETADGQGICKRTLARLERLPIAHGAYALYGLAPEPRCVSRGFTVPVAPPADRRAAQVRILPDGETLRVFLYDAAGAVEGIAQLPRDELARVADTPRMAGAFGIELVQGDQTMQLRAIPDGSRLDDEIVVDQPLGNGSYGLRLHTAVPPLTVMEALTILAPVLMWLWASVVGWVLVQHLLLGPLGKLRKVVAAYRPGDRVFDLPTVRTPAREIGELGESFAEVTRTVARHEANLEAALRRQKRLVREVHHRVKNNLQVVASLLNLHSRGSANEEVAAAYASIQRRVDALAVVHRNHYAELEENRGVALKPLLSELAANLRATAPVKAALMQIRLDVAPLHVTQDVAVSIAFLVTEISEFGMLCGASDVSIALEPAEPGFARLSITVDSLADECDEAQTGRFERIVTGLARQLRSPLERDPARGRYTLTITTV